MRLPTKLLLAVLLAAPSAGMSAGAAQVGASKAAVEEQSFRTLPDFTLPDLKGQQIRAADLKDKVVVLDFWATWCAPCVAEIPSYNSLQEKYAARGAKVIGLAVQSGWPSDIKRFVARHKMQYTILAGNDDTVADFDVINFPTTYIIAPGWKLYKKYSGSFDGKAADIERDIEELLKTK